MVPIYLSMVWDARVEQLLRGYSAADPDIWLGGQHQVMDPDIRRGGHIRSRIQTLG